MRELAVSYEKRPDGTWSATVIELPGLSVVGKTLDEATSLLQDAVKLHIEALRHEGQEVDGPVVLAARTSKSNLPE